MGGAGAGAGCGAVLPSSCSTAFLLVELAADHWAVQGCSGADEPPYKGQHIAVGDRLQLPHQGLLVQAVLAEEVDSGPLSHFHLPPVTAGCLLDLLLQPVKQGFEVSLMFFEEGSPDCAAGCGTAHSR